MGGIVGVKLVRVSKDRPTYQVLPESPKEQSEVRDQRFHPGSLQCGVDTKISAPGGIKAGIGETDRVKGGEPSNIHVGCIVQWELPRV